MIEITDREMDKAFRSHDQATGKLPGLVPSRLTCLFYAAECGLKTVIMRQDRHRTTSGIDHYKFVHNINKMLDHLRCEQNLRLPSSLVLPDLKSPARQRKAEQSDINQVWRYGVDLKNTEERDKIIQTLEKICLWVKEQRR